jgi:D-sedoheptulose 7-phosphate isomerase
MKSGNIEGIIRTSLEEAIRVKREMINVMSPAIMEAVEMLAACIGENHRVYLMGNGGSASQAQHMAAELIGRFELESSPLPAVALTADSSVLTALGNDYGYQDIFARQVDALVSSGDVVVCFSTSGASENVIRGAERAKAKGARVIGFLGTGESPLSKVVDLGLHVPSARAGRVQEGHITLVHVICEALERLPLKTRKNGA